MTFLRDRFVDDDEMARDGETIRHPMLIMDHQPHYVSVNDKRVQDARTAARDAYFEMVRRAENAWRTPGRDAAEPDNSSRPLLMRRHLEPDEPDDDVQARRDAIWHDYKTRLGNAWKTDPRAASAIEQQGERWRGGR